MAIATTNPTTGEVIQTFTPLTSEEISAKIAIAHQAFHSYKSIPLPQRSEWLKQAADILEADKYRLGAIATLEMGKTLKSAIAEVEKCAVGCRYYAEHGAKFLQDVTVPTDARLSFVRYQPLGIILAVMPWNFPYWQVFRFAAPALMAGNVGLLKHASNVPQCALAIAEIIEQAGFPSGVFQTLLIGAGQVEQIMRDPRVKAATLTGSEAAGQSLATIAGHELKKTVLELGGSDPFIVLKTANIDLAVQTAVSARMINNSQSCIAAKRFILEETIAEEFQIKLVQAYQKLKVGDPMQPDTDLGPLATSQIRAEIHQQVQHSLTQGAKLLIGGEFDPEQIGNFYPPTILTNIPKSAPAYSEEMFGPVASLFRVPDLDAAIALANDTSLGLGASAWTEDQHECDRLVNEIEAGSVFINGMVKSDCSLPFGGIKRSGYGRELGMLGMQEFLNIKTVWIK
ncbi:NAD-dependent aldehyde dehydrogenase [Synechococcus sp. PCC 7502]|uniref:NAD-dependent succinate-semialdehyde dehydrogenase n=1 Tax=Synechococcus sp. PCC 7502 TaxID=1173263 RepID=UPI00029F9EE7|nr:NAD-dependent succinate-semialdehyde dehydrogenase [Synechococcus sp. PCC 7502]AFY75142.1 NAD-dependent aldehyde dehydrogenase [Synechococcus sp. PCC 7502]